MAGDECCWKDKTNSDIDQATWGSFTSSPIFRPSLGSNPNMTTPPTLSLQCAEIKTYGLKISIFCASSIAEQSVKNAIRAKRLSLNILSVLHFSAVAVGSIGVTIQECKRSRRIRAKKRSFKTPQGIDTAQGFVVIRYGKTS
jgi:hypothetical protein